jgi:hypothetical protein
MAHDGPCYLLPHLVHGAKIKSPCENTGALNQNQLIQSTSLTLVGIKKYVRLN